MLINFFIFQIRALTSSIKFPRTTDSRLLELGASIPGLVTRSVAVNTLKTYNQGFRAWKHWSRCYPGVDTLPIKGLHFAFFVTSVVQQNGKFGKIEQAFYGVNWLHKVLGLPNPCDSPLVRNVKEAAKRILKKPKVKKCPIRPHHLESLVNQFADTENLLSIRILAIALLSYAGFLRYDEVSRVKRNNIHFEKTYLKLFLESSKTDQEGDGDTVYIARTGRSTCPFNMLRKYLRIAGIESSDSNYIFRPSVRTKAGHRLKNVSKPISYSTARDTVMAAVESIGLDRNLFGLHSFRRGGATEAAKRGVSDRLFKKHGRWSTDNAKDGYVSEDIEARLSVSRKLGI